MIFEFLRKAVVKIFNLKSEFKIETAVSEEMRSAIELWKLIYKNDAPWLEKNVKSLNLAALLSSELARMVTIEMKSEITGSERADYLNGIYSAFLGNIRQHCEYACALGGVVFKPYYNNGLFIECIRADRFYPVEFNLGGDVISAVFIEKKKIGNDIYTRLESHKLQNKSVTITNTAYKNNRPVDLSSVGEWSGLSEKVQIDNVKRPLFSYFKMPFANNVDNNSPLGISVFSKAVDLIKEADRQYSRLLWEFEGGELAIDVDRLALNKDGKLPKLNERLFRQLDFGDEQKKYNVFNPNYRDISLINGLNVILQKIEDICGFARGTISDPNQTEKTATEFKITRQRTFSTICDTQKALENALRGLVEVLDIYTSLYCKNIPKGKLDVSFEWDDSIVVDRDVEYLRRKEMIREGLYDKVRFYSWYFGVSMEQAEKELPKFDEISYGGTDE